MDIAVFIIERRQRVLLVKSENQWILPGGMILPGEKEKDVLEEKVFFMVGRRVKKIFKQLEDVFHGTSKAMSCEIRATAFVGEVDLDGCEIPEEKRSEVGWFSRRNIPLINLSDVAKKALNCYFA